MNELSEKKKTGVYLTGKVVSDKMDCTAVIVIERKVRHELYGKYISRSTRLYAHDAKNECKKGDLVTVVSSRPLSKTKRWRVVEILGSEA